MKNTLVTTIVLISCISAEIPFIFNVYTSTYAKDQDSMNNDAWGYNNHIMAVADGHDEKLSDRFSPHHFPNKLLENMMHVYHMSPEEYEKNPLKLLESTVRRTSIPGSSTVLLVALEHEKVLKNSTYINVINLGDSRFMLFRKTKHSDSSHFYRFISQNNVFN